MKTESPDHVLAYGERRIPYRLRLSDRKRLRIIVKPDLSVTADAPCGFSQEDVREAIQSKAPWIVRQLAELEDYHPLPSPHKFVSGETFVYLGRQYRLKVETGEKRPAKLLGRFLHVSVPEKANARSVKTVVDAWYRARAADVFHRYLATCMKVTNRHGIHEPILTIREMRTRWGSCTAAGRVTLNLRLIHAPVHCIEYVVMHELCHLVHHDHSPQFFRLLTRCMPDWKKRREILSRVVLNPTGNLS
jgi:predicted metal-dependent hydrolase